VGGWPSPAAVKGAALTSDATLAKASTVDAEVIVKTTLACVATALLRHICQFDASHLEAMREAVWELLPRVNAGGQIHLAPQCVVRVTLLAL
jgi:hypothetical protein